MKKISRPQWKRTAISSAVIAASATWYLPPTTLAADPCPGATNNINTTTTGNCQLGGTDSISITNTGVLSASSFSAIYVDNTATGVSIDNSGIIQGTTTGIYLDATSVNTTILNNGSILADVTGIFYEGDLSGSLTNESTGIIRADMPPSSAYGVYIEGDLAGTLTNSGSINAIADTSAAATATAAATGIYVFGKLSNSLSNNGTINASVNASASTSALAAAAGIYTDDELSGTLANSGTITASANATASFTANAAATGIYVFGKLSSSLSNNGTINVSSYVSASSRATANAVDIHLDEELSGTLANSGNIIASATANAFSNASADVTGIYLDNNLSGTLANSGTIAVTANASNDSALANLALAAGISVGGDLSGTLDNSSSIQTNAIANGNSASNNAFATGIFIGGNLSGTLNNSGTIAAAANANGTLATGNLASATGIYISSDVSGTLSNSGTINAAANLGTTAMLSIASAHGIYVDGTFSGTLDNSGTITAMASSPIGASSAQGIYIDTLGATANLVNSGNISASVAGTGSAFGVYINNTSTGARFTNTGSIDTMLVAGGDLGISGTGEIGVLTGTGNMLNVFGAFMAPLTTTGFATVNVLDNASLNVGATSSTMDGDLVMGANSTFNTTINSNIANDAGVLTVAGVVTTPGSMTVTVDSAGIAIANGTDYLILDGGIGSNITVPGAVTDNSLFTDFIANTSGEALTVTAGPSAEISDPAAFSANAFAVLGPLQEVLPADPGLATAISTVTTTEQLNDILETFAPDMSRALLLTTITTSHTAVLTVLNHLLALRMDGTMMTSMAADAAYSDIGVWIQGFGTTIDQDNRGGIAGFEADTTGVTIGADTPVTSRLRLGAAFSYANTNTNTKGFLNSTNIDSYQGTLYASSHIKESFLEASFSYGMNNYDGSRQTGLVNRVARADYGADQINFQADYGLKYSFGNEIHLNPYLGIDYIRLAIDGYTESGAGALNLSVQDEDYATLESVLGVIVRKNIHTTRGRITPEIHAAWRHEFLDEAQINTSTFTGGGAAFTTNGFDPANDSLNLGGSLSAYSAENLEFKARYDFETKADFTGHSGSLILRYLF